MKQRKPNAPGVFGRTIALVLILLSHTGFAYEANPRSEAKMVRDVRTALQFTRRIHMQGIRIFAAGPGKVTLSGQVPSQREKELALSTAAGLTGIAEVNDQLRVGPQGIQKDLQLKSAIERTLEDEPALSADDTVVVKVDQGVVVLDGSVSNSKVLRKVVQDSFEAGAKKVVSQLIVRNELNGSIQSRSYDREPTSTGG